MIVIKLKIKHYTTESTLGMTGQKRTFCMSRIPEQLLEATYKILYSLMLCILQL